MEEPSVFTAASDARAMKRSPTTSAETMLPLRFSWVPVGTGISTHSRVPLGDQFAAFADELSEWAELDLVVGLEGWPDDDWSDL